MILLKNNYYEEDEKLFSTGDSELDDLLEEVYYSGISDGYDYFQKEFARVITGQEKELGKKISGLVKNFRTAKRQGNGRLAAIYKDEANKLYGEYNKARNAGIPWNKPKYSGLVIKG